MTEEQRNLHEIPLGSSKPRPGGPPNEKTNPLDEEIDRALDRATGRDVAPEVDLKRQWDEEMEAELEQSLQGLNLDDVAASTARPRRPEGPAESRPARGQEATRGLRKGKVIRVKEPYVFIDLGAKSEGYVPAEQFGEALPNPGDEIEVVVDKFDPAAGLTRLNLKGATVEADWSSVQRDMVVEARVVKAIKGGAEVDVGGMRGFLPISQIDLVRVESVEDYINQRFPVVVTEANPREKNLVVSRRELLERQRAEQREKTWDELEEGQVRSGTVRSIKDFGAFVDLGGVDGLIHVSDLSYSRDVKVGDLLKTGDEIQVKVLRVDRDAQRVGLGLKQLAPSPWDTVEMKYGRGQMVTGKVVRTVEFGAFVELEPGVEGLIHISELAPGRTRRVRDIVQEGQEVDARILDIDAEAHRISLSLKPTAKDELPTEDEAEGEGEGDETPRPKKVRKVPLKGGLGDRDSNPFSPR